MPPSNPPRLVYVIGTYPLLTTTFIDREIEVLRRLGVSVDLVSIRRPSVLLSDHQRALAAGVRYVLPASPLAVVWSHMSFLVRRPARYLTTLFRLISAPHRHVGARIKTLLHFGLAVHVARIVRHEHAPEHLHAHFVDRAAVVALVAGRLLGLPFSATAHANDIYVDPVLLPEKISNAKFVATCTGYNASHLGSIDGAGDRVRCIYHGLDVSDYAPPMERRRDRPLVLAVGQLKEKKGLAHLIEACARLTEAGYDLECEIVGEGPLRGRLEESITAAGLASRVRLRGSLPHDAVVDRYRDATLFVLPCITGPDGDRDGIPNVILEAMAMALPVVSTWHSGIPEAVDDGVTGLLVAPADTDALAAAMARLLDDEGLRSKMGEAGRNRVAEVFDATANVERLLEEIVA